MNARRAVLLGLLFCACQRSAVAANAAAGPKRVRAAAVAGQFYPADSKELEAVVHKLSGRRAEGRVGTRQRILTPHAGYEFSGAVAAASFRQLAAGFERAVVVAGNQASGLDDRGVAVDRATHYAVPGLEVPLAPAAGLGDSAERPVASPRPV